MIRRGEGDCTNAECLARSIDLIGLLLLPLCSVPRGVGANEDVNHSLEDARRCDRRRGTSAGGATGATVLWRWISAKGRMAGWRCEASPQATERI